MFFPLFDWTIILLIPAIILAVYAQMRVSSTFNRFSQVASRKRMTASEVARGLIRENGLDVKVERVEGRLTDHYDPRTKVLRLSAPIHDSSSLAALGVAAHEVGHAVQHNLGYAALGLRNSLVPVANLGSTLSFPILLIGLFMGIPMLVQIGVFAFAAVVLFQLITLPVEFNASRRAIALLTDGGYIGQDEVGPARSVLNAAALTYVAAALMAILNLLRLLFLSGLFGGGDDD
ncbi:MAG: zinc metallopeptidase [Firmicutes bacterium]|nr:zinc metallopeptidase [Bacillota bacterium]